MKNILSLSKTSGIQRNNINNQSIGGNKNKTLNKRSQDNRLPWKQQVQHKSIINFLTT